MSPPAVSDGRPTRLRVADLLQVLDARAGCRRRPPLPRGPARTCPLCPGWRVRDLVRHLGAVHRWAAALVTDRATTPPPIRSAGPSTPRPTRRRRRSGPAGRRTRRSCTAMKPEARAAGNRPRSAGTSRWTASTHRCAASTPANGAGCAASSRACCGFVRWTRDRTPCGPYGSRPGRP
ncbi:MULTISPECIES: maleylpyruvate isomerase N-terminal domain-containing protein [Streptomyces]|uniref:maleylpyruvate isomerase N-terminal domain-containing protein n=1 Tax=Streptomyces TaxID=1883 RepID=UPI003323D701